MLCVERYTPDKYEQWNRFIGESVNGSVFHRLDFLAYHKSRFEENICHLLITDDAKSVAVIPLGVFQVEGKKVARSPFGASYGGFVFAEDIGYCEAKELIALFLEYVRGQAIDEIVIVPSIAEYCRSHSDTFTFALLERGFKFFNSDITSIVMLDDNWEKRLHHSRLRNIRKAIKSNVICKNHAPPEDFWITVEATFNKHGVPPTHTFEEWKWLCENLPKNVWCEVAYFEGKPIAGIGQIKLNDIAEMSFYLSNDLAYQEMQGQSLLIYETLKSAYERGIKYYDLGTASVNMAARENIFMFKERFGAVGVFRHTYRLVL